MTIWMLASTDYYLTFCHLFIPLTFCIVCSQLILSFQRVFKSLKSSENLLKFKKTKIKEQNAWKINEWAACFLAKEKLTFLIREGWSQDLLESLPFFFQFLLILDFFGFRSFFLERFEPDFYLVLAWKCCHIKAWWHFHLRVKLQ